MALSRPLHRPAVYQQPLAGDKDGVNRAYTTPGAFRPETICVYRNGVRQERDGDFVVTESGGPGSGYDTVIFEPQLPPLAWEKLFVDYVPSV